MKNIISIRGLGVAYGKSQVLAGMDWTVPAGITALLGENGAGKSTTMRAILGLIRPSGGSIELLGSAVRGPLPAEVARDVAWLPQDASFPRGTIVNHAIAYAVWLKGRDRKAARGAAAEAIELFSLGELASRSTHTLSGGQRRKVALACTFASKPKVAILDEPTAGLDPRQRDDLLELLRTAALEHPESGIVFSTHLLEDVVLAADRIDILRDGGIRYSARLESLIPRGGDRYAAMRVIREAAFENETSKNGARA